MSKKFHNTIKLPQRTSVLLLLVSGKKQDNEPFSSLRKSSNYTFILMGKHDSHTPMGFEPMTSPSKPYILWDANNNDDFRIRLARDMSYMKQWSNYGYLLKNNRIETRDDYTDELTSNEFQEVITVERNNVAIQHV